MVTPKEDIKVHIWQRATIFKYTKGLGHWALPNFFFKVLGSVWVEHLEFFISHFELLFHVTDTQHYYIEVFYHWFYCLFVYIILLNLPILPLHWRINKKWSYLIFYIVPQKKTKIFADRTPFKKKNLETCVIIPKLN